MSELPDGWSLMPLGEACKVVSGATPKTAVSENWGGDIPWITPADLSKQRSKSTRGGDRFITDSGLKSCSAQLLPAGSVLFSSRAPIGYISIAEVPMATNQGFKSLVPGPDVDSEYLYYYLTYITPEIQSRASGTTFPEVSGKVVADTPLILPPLDVQQRIVETLEDHLSRLDKALADVELQLRKLHPLRLALLRKAFDRNQREGEGQAPELKSSLGELVSVRYGKDVPKSERTELGTFPVVGSAGVMTYTELFLTKKPAVLVGRKGNVGSVQLFMDGCHPVDTAYLLEVPEAFIPKYLFYQLESKDLKSLDSSTAIPSLRRQDLESVQVIAPSIQTQEFRIRELEAELARIETAYDRFQAVKISSEKLRRSLLHAAFTGQLINEDSYD